MALTGRDCGHQYRPGVQFCIVCGDARPERQESAPVHQPSAMYQPTHVHQPGPAYQPTHVHQGAPAYQAAPVLYHPPAAPARQARLGPPGSPPNRPRRLRALLIGLVVFLAAGWITAAVMLIAHPLQRGAVAPPIPTTSASASTSKSVGEPAQEAAAQGLAGLLAQSVTDRSSIVAAANDVMGCGPSLHQDPQTFASAVTSRQNLLGRLASLPGRPALPAPMLAALTSAWQNSIKADQDYAQWAQDEIANGCTANNQTDPNAQAATGPDNQATLGKKTFAGLWDPIAAKYGLPAYQWNQL
jgi:hypothetical protein